MSVVTYPSIFAALLWVACISLQLGDDSRPAGIAAACDVAGTSSSVLQDAPKPGFGFDLDYGSDWFTVQAEFNAMSPFRPAATFLATFETLGIRAGFQHDAGGTSTLFDIQLPSLSLSVLHWLFPVQVHP